MRRAGGYRRVKRRPMNSDSPPRERGSYMFPSAMKRSKKSLIGAIVRERRRDPR
jgi:hypothetical protein